MEEFPSIKASVLRLVRPSFTPFFKESDIENNIPCSGLLYITIQTSDTCFGNDPPLKGVTKGQRLGMSVFASQDADADADDSIVGGCAPLFSVVSDININAGNDQRGEEPFEMEIHRKHLISENKLHNEYCDW